MGQKRQAALRMQSAVEEIFCMPFSWLECAVHNKYTYKFPLLSLSCLKMQYAHVKLSAIPTWKTFCVKIFLLPWMARKVKGFFDRQPSIEVANYQLLASKLLLIINSSWLLLTCILVSSASDELEHWNKKSWVRLTQIVLVQCVCFIMFIQSASNIQRQAQMQSLVASGSIPTAEFLT